MRQRLNPTQLKKFNKRTYSMHRHQLERFEDLTDLPREAFPIELGALRVFMEKQVGTNCFYCFDKIKVSNMSLDHKIPICRAIEARAVIEELIAKSIEDLHSRFSRRMTEGALCIAAAFEWGNLDVVCLRCNKRKGDLTHYEFVMVVRFVGTLANAASKYIMTKLGARLPFYKKAKGE